MFLLTMFFMDGPVSNKNNTKSQATNDEVHDNKTFTDDNGQPIALELPRLSIRSQLSHNERY